MLKDTDLKVSWKAKLKMALSLSPSSLLQMAKTATHLFSFMRLDLLSFSFFAARHFFLL